MSKIKSASFTRYTKVLKILQGDPLLRKELSKVMVAVCRPDQTSQDFPQEVVYVVDKIHEQNLDVATCTNKDILFFAFDLLIKNRAKIPSYAATPEPEPVSPKAKAARVAKPKAAPKAAPVSTKRKTPKAGATADVPPPVVAPKSAGESKKLLFVRPNIPYVVGCAALANLQAVLTLLEPFETAGDVEAKDVGQKLNALIDDIHRRTVIPSAKETTETTAG